MRSEAPRFDDHLQDWFWVVRQRGVGLTMLPGHTPKGQFVARLERGQRCRYGTAYRSLVLSREVVAVECAFGANRALKREIGEIAEMANTYSRYELD